MTKRIQMSRQAPWRDDNPDAVIITRPLSYLSNPFRVYEHCKGKQGDWGVEDTGRFRREMGHGWTKLGAVKAAVSLYQRVFDEEFPPGSTIRLHIALSLHEKDLACWCPLDMPCHGDYLLEVGREWQAYVDNHEASEETKTAV